jgi:choline dehydrogenase-like flavoprotein
MPIIDSSALAGSDALPSRLQSDECIAGAGPADITIARELAASRLRVTILESGGAERQPEVDALNEIESVGWPRVMDQWLVRNRIVGGNSHSWVGRCAPFDEIDLQYRDWVPYSGWPFRVAELGPYLERSAKYLGLFIAGSSVFPTAGHANPTRMIVALGLRLADTLKNRATAVAAVRRSAPDLAIQTNTEP